MKRNVLIVFTTSFCVWVVIWMFYTPYTPGRLLYAVPDRASLVTIHENIAGRYQDFLENPLTASLIHSAGITEENIQQLSENPQVDKILQALFSGECTLSYVPPGVVTHSDAWIFTDWLGWKATIFRSALMWGHLEGIEEKGSYNTYPVYEIELPGQADSRNLAFFVVDGGIIGCISSSADTIRRIIHLYDGRKQTGPEKYERLNADLRLKQAPDKGWFSGFGENNKTCLFALSEISSNSLRGICQFETEKAFQEKEAISLVPIQAARFCGPLAQAFICTTPSAAIHFIGAAVPRFLRMAIEQAVDLVQPKQVFFSLFGNDYSGRYAGIKVPALVLGLGLPPEVNARFTLSQYIDFLNAIYKIGLVPEMVSVAGGGIVYVLEGTADNAYSKRPFNERIAYTLINNMLIVSTSAQTLIKLVARNGRDESQQDIPNVAWLKMIEQTKSPVTGCFWLALDRGGKALRLALTAYSLKLMQDDMQKSQAQRQQINEAKAWIDALAPMKELRVWLSSQSNTTTEITFEMGR